MFAIGGRSPLGLRGLKLPKDFVRLDENDSRSPLGLRGLKSFVAFATASISFGRSPLGLRGLKYYAADLDNGRIRRSPLGLRGLKLLMCSQWQHGVAVAALLGCVD